jgi:hypothetical protein
LCFFILIKIVQTTTEITTNVQKKRKGNFHTTGSINDLNEWSGPGTKHLDHSDSDDDYEEDATMEMPGGNSYPGVKTTTKQRSRKYQRKNVTDECVSSFRITDEIQILALVEGLSWLQGADGGTGNTAGSAALSTSLEDYRRKLEQKRRPDVYPQSGRFHELPSISLSGLWSAELTLENGIDSSHPDRLDVGEGSTGKEQNAEERHGDVASLEGYRLCIRHESYSAMGPLRTGNEIDSDGEDIVDEIGYCRSSDGKYTKRKSSGHNGSRDENHDIIVSVNFPNKNRMQDIASQNVGRKLTNAFIGSITLVGTQGFQTCNDLNGNAPNTTKDLLTHVEVDRSGSSSSTGPAGGGYRPLLLPVSGTGPEGPSIGVSIFCGLSLDSNYHLRIAQNNALPDNPIVAIDGKSFFLICASLYFIPDETFSYVFSFH